MWNDLQKSVGKRKENEGGQKQSVQFVSFKKIEARISIGCLHLLVVVYHVSDPRASRKETSFSLCMLLGFFLP